MIDIRAEAARLADVAGTVLLGAMIVGVVVYGSFYLVVEMLALLAP